MDKIINKLLLLGDRFMLEMKVWTHFGQPGSKYSSWWQFTKSKEKIRKFKETGDLWYIYQDELDKACFQHDMA